MKAVFAAIAAAALALPANAQATDRYAPKPYVQFENVPWARDAVIYELNTRHFTKEGTFRAAQRQLPRLKKMGVDIVWLMPVHPIGQKNRKGTLGSPYSVKDYFGVNPEFGTLADLKAFVAAAHRQGMKVILDLVANHTAWDNPWVTQHPDWYERDWKGDYHPTPWWDWSDIIDLDYSKPGVRREMTRAMVHWLKVADIDGYRADVAGYVPTDFWENAREEMEAVKPVFMLGEWQERDLHRRAFDATYAWDWWTTMHNIAQGKADATALYGFYSGNESAWPLAAMRMMFTENHDKNAWEATQYEAFGQGLPAAIALSFVGEGIPLIHNGQEACNERRLTFFEKDLIDWAKPCQLDEVFTNLAALKKANPALHNGRWGARMEKLENSAPKQLFSFIRRKDGNRVVGLFNFSGQPVSAKLSDAHGAGRYRDFTTGKVVTLDTGSTVTLPAWGYQILTSQEGG